MKSSQENELILIHNVQQPEVLLPGNHTQWETDHVQPTEEDVHEGRTYGHQ